MLSQMTWTDILTLIIAVLGVGIGLVNTVWAVARHRTRLHIAVEHTPPHIAELNEENPMIVRVVNTSLFPVTLNDLYLARRWFLPMIEVNFFIPDKTSWPQRLEPGAEYSIQIWRNSLDRPGVQPGLDRSLIKGICVLTATGKKFCKTSRALRQFLQDRR